MNKILKQSLILLFIVFILILPYFVFAETASVNPAIKGLTDVKGPYADITTDAGGNDILGIIGKAIGTLLGLLGVIFIVLMIYAGYNWMTAAGEESKVETAQETIKRAIIGLIIVVGSYALQVLIFDKLLS